MLRMRCVLSTLGTLALTPSLLAAANFSVAPLKETARQLPSAILPLLGSGVRVGREGTPLVDLWLRRTIPVRAASSELGVAFTQIAPGTLIGVARFHASWLDYRNQMVAPGLYTLRYLVQPADGNHMGVTLYRDFLLLVPAHLDPEPDRQFTFDELVKLSGHVTGTPHPAVMGLFPLQDQGAAAIVQNDMEQPTLSLPAGSLRLGLVLSGHGELEGY